MTFARISSFNRTALKAALASAVVLGSTGLVGTAHAANDSTNATATVMAPITIVKATDLAFGKFSALTGGTIKVDTDNGISVTGGVLKGTGSTGTAARFNLTGDTNNSYSISYSGAGNTALTHTDNSTTMALAKVSALTAASGTTGLLSVGALSAGVGSIYVGGTLTVATGQLPGVYSGSITVTVDYN